MEGSRRVDSIAKLPSMRSHLLPALGCALAMAAVSILPAQQPGFARVFDSHMVLQQHRPVRVWGWGTAGQSAVVQFDAQEHHTTVDASGAWSVTLEPLQASAVGRTLSVATGDETFTLEDVVVGEVWICGGQSNMRWTVRGTRDADLEIACADDPLLRFVRLPNEARGEPRRDYARPEHGGAGKSWRAIDAKSVVDCTGVGYYFAQRLRRHLKVPVGIVEVAWGGTSAQFWVPKPRLREFASVAPMFTKFEAAMAKWSEGGGEAGAKRAFERDLATWRKLKDTPHPEGADLPKRPDRRNYQNPSHKRHPGGGYDGMLVPLSGFTARGALYFQGENNAFGDMFRPFPDTYPAVIQTWRELFANAELPIGLIQIGGWSNRRTMTYDMNHHTNVVREVQFDTWRRTKNTGLIVTFDLNSNGNIHPGHKRPVGDRAARWALAEVYGAKGHDKKPLRWRGPVYAGSEVTQKGRIRVRFEAPTAAGLRLDKDQALGFYLAGEDRMFHKADARVVDKTMVEVFCDAVPQPVAVRYAWSNLPLGSLMNGKELPAYPFRSDNWPLKPHRSDAEYVRR